MIYDTFMHVDVGYARVSTIEQMAGFEAQKCDIEKVGVTKLFAKQVSSVAQRSQLDAALNYVREGDTLIVTKLDRLARSTQHLLEAKGVGLQILDFGGGSIDTKSPTGRLMLTMFAAFAQFERELNLERQRGGDRQSQGGRQVQGPQTHSPRQGR